MSYTPKPDGAAARAIAHLATLAPGAGISGGELAEAIGAESSNIKSLLGSAIRADEIRVDISDPRKHLYSLPATGAARRVASVFDYGGSAPADPGEAPPQPRRTKRVAAKPPRKPAFPGAPKAAKAPKPPRKAARQPRPVRVHAGSAVVERISDAPPVPRLECAVFNTGAMLIEAAGQPPLRLSRDQTLDLVAYLSRIAHPALELTPMTTDDTIVQIPLEHLAESPFNPRRIYAGIDELAANIQAEGRIHEPLLVRPLLGNRHEIVFGHRRLRAAALAGLAHVPCMVREMTDAQARSAQVAENLQRADVHPFEEAEAFRLMVDAGDASADELAERFGKSRSYVYGRLKLLQACDEVRKACLAGEIGAEVALLIARVGDAATQAKALAAIKGRYFDLEDGGNKSYRQVRDLLNEKFTLALKDALFDPSDATLLPDAGPCGACPKRSGNAPEFADVAAGKDDDQVHDELGVDADDDALEAAHERAGHWSYGTNLGADVCTDCDCFDAKKKAHLQRQAAALQAQGRTVITGAKARAAVDAQGHVKGAYVALADVKGQLPKKKGTAAPETVLIQDPRGGKTFEAVAVADLQAAGVKVKPPKSSQDSYAVQQRRWQLDRERAEAKRQKERAARAAVLDAVLHAAAARDRSLFDLQALIDALLTHYPWNARELLARRMGHASYAALCKQVGQMPAASLPVFALHAALAIGVADADHNDEWLRKAAKHYCVDVEAVRTADAADIPAPAAPARKKGKAKAAQGELLLEEAASA